MKVIPARYGILAVALLSGPTVWAQEAKPAETTTAVRARGRAPAEPARERIASGGFPAGERNGVSRTSPNDCSLRQTLRNSRGVVIKAAQLAAESLSGTKERS